MVYVQWSDFFILSVVQGGGEKDVVLIIFIECYVEVFVVMGVDSNG